MKSERALLLVALATTALLLAASAAPSEWAFVPFLSATGVVIALKRIRTIAAERAKKNAGELEQVRAAAAERLKIARSREAECRHKLDHLFRVRELVRTVGCSVRVNETLEAIGRAARGTLGARFAAIRFRDARGSVVNFFLNPEPHPLTEVEAERIWMSAAEPDVVSRDLRGTRSEAILLDFRWGRSVSAEPVDEDAVDILASVSGLALEKAFLFQEVETLARIDAVTGVYNRRSLDEIFATEWDRATHLAMPLSALMIDIDRFKNFNDTYGHAVGDLVLKAVADALRHALRDMDVVARYGGEEFVVLLPETDIEHAMVAAERMRTAIAEIRLIAPDHHEPLRVTASIGVADRIGRRSPDEMLAGADQALYRAKRGGRNRSEAQIVSEEQNAVAA